MDFVQIKDRLAACMEPLNPVSGYRWSAGGGCYVEVKDASTQMFFSSMSKGVHVWENTYVVSRPGTYEAGITVQGLTRPSTRHIRHRPHWRLQINRCFMFLNS